MCTSGMLPGRTRTAETAGSISTPASVATMNCQTPCCGRLAPKSEAAGQTARAATMSRVAAAAEGSVSQPTANAADSPARAAAATTAQAAAGTAVVPRARKQPAAAARAVTIAAASMRAGGGIVDTVVGERGFGGSGSGLGVSVVSE